MCIYVDNYRIRRYEFEREWWIRWSRSWRGGGKGGNNVIQYVHVRNSYKN